MVRMAISRWTTSALRTSLQDAAGSSIIKQIWLLDENPMTEAEFLEKFHMELDDQQRAAMRIAGRHALLLAVPGSGKTAVITARTGYMLFCRGIDAGEILTLTFSRAAAEEMRRRFTETFALPPSQTPAFRTIHSLCRSVLSAHCARTATPLPDLISERKPVLRALYRALFPDAEYPEEALISTIDARITYVKNMLFSKEQIEAENLEGVDFPALYRAYEAENRARGRMDFDDQLLMAYRLIRQEPRVLAALRARYHYVNVDEAQDTSYVQHRIIYLLAQPGELFMVGDEDQSIYGFRAAYPEVFLRFGEIYPGAAILRLETNYRSSGAIAYAAACFIRRNRQRSEKNMRAAKPVGEPIRIVQFSHLRAQYPWLVKELAGIAPGETAAVLYRNNGSALPLLEALAKAGIAFECAGERSAEFFSCARVRYALGVLDFALHFGNADVFAKVYHRLGIYITSAECETVLAARAKGDARAPLAMLAELYAGSRREEAVRQCEAELRSMASMQPPRAVQYAWRKANGLPQTADDLQKLNILCALAESCGDLAGVLPCAERLRAWEGAAQNGAHITLSTIHAAKGREFDRVYLIDLMAGILPAEGDLAQAGTSAAAEEEARLFYVGVTRARDSLTLVRPMLGYCGLLRASPFIRAFTARMRGSGIPQQR